MVYYKFISEMRKPYRATVIARELNWFGKENRQWEEPYDPKRGKAEQLYNRLKTRVALKNSIRFRKAFEKWRKSDGLFS